MKSICDPAMQSILTKLQVIERAMMVAVEGSAETPHDNCDMDVWRFRSKVTTESPQYFGIRNRNYVQDKTQK